MKDPLDDLNRLEKERELREFNKMMVSMGEPELTQAELEKLLSAHLSEDDVDRIYALVRNPLPNSKNNSNTK